MIRRQREGGMSCITGKSEDETAGISFVDYFDNTGFAFRLFLRGRGRD
jgi:hypothetical protein